MHFIVSGCDAENFAGAFHVSGHAVIVNITGNGFGDCGNAFGQFLGEVSNAFITASVTIGHHGFRMFDVAGVGDQSMGKWALSKDQLALPLGLQDAAPAQLATDE